MFVPKYNARQIFTKEQEVMLADYFVEAVKHNYGHSPCMARRLAYEFAYANSITIPDSWWRDCAAGEEWLTGFMKRHETISIRVPEATSLGRSTAFNKFNTNKFFDNLELVYGRHAFGPESIYNCDETGVTTVQRPVKVLAGKGIKQVRSMTSQEKGQLVTVCCTTNAVGNTVHHSWCFPVSTSSLTC